MFSPENVMDPKPQPDELKHLTTIEQQLICRISPCINVHMLKHGGIASSGHCVTFPQELNEPAQIFPRLPNEINILKVRKLGLNHSSKEFRVRRKKIQLALEWLKNNNPAYADIKICKERLSLLPEDGELTDIPTAEYNSSVSHLNDLGPAPDQIQPGEIDGETASSVLLPDVPINLQEKVTNIVKDVVGESHGEVTVNKKGTVTIPWPTRDNNPLSEFTTQYFFTLAFPCLFPYATGDFHINRPVTCTSLANWADHLLWYEDGRFASHHYFKFVVHNMIMRKAAIEKGNFIIRQQLGDQHFSIEDLRNKIQNGDYSLSNKIVYLSATLRGTSQYWAQRAKELRSLSQYQISKGHGLPSFFTTGSCAEYHFKPLKRLLQMYKKDATGEEINLNDPALLFETLQQNTHIVAHYFDLRTTSYFREVMGPVFGVDTYWYRQEFAKSRGMIHWHGLCWRSDREPHNLIHEALKAGLSDDQCAVEIENWAKIQLGMTASHPAGKDDNGQPRKDLWPPPEGTAPAPLESKNPLVKLLMDVSQSQESLLEDKNGSLRIEMTRDHPMLVQHSRYHTQGWRANGDISLVLSKSPPDNPSVDEIIATEKYITGYACKGNQPTGAISDLFNDMVHTSDESSGSNAKSICTKVLINTVKRDVSSVEVSFELSSLPLYRSSHTFKSVSLSGARVLEKDGQAISRNNALDKYLFRDKNKNVSFYEFVCEGGKVPVFSGCTINATWPLEEEYCRTMLFLHWPSWRHISDIKDENLTWCQKMSQFLCSDKCPNFVKADVERAKRKQCPINDNESDDELSICSQQPDWMEAIRPNFEFESPVTDFNYDDGGDSFYWSKTKCQYPDDLGNSWIQNLTDQLDDENESLKIPDVDLSTMNHEQNFAFNIIMNKILEISNKSKDFQPLRMIVTGTAVSGKSYLIKCLVKSIRSYFGTNKSVQVICPTGNSANIIAGVTLHSFLKVPTNYKDPPIYDCKNSLPAALHGLLVWKEFSVAVALKTIVRQNNEEDEFRNVLLSLREYRLISSQSQWLQNFQWQTLKKKYGDKFISNLSAHALHVFPTHDQVWEHNKEKILDVNKYFPIAKLDAICKGPHSKSASSAKSNGLLLSIYICENARVMLTVNLCVKYGLFNGAIGTVFDIVYPPNKMPTECLPTVVMVQFPNYTGPAFIQSHPKVIPQVPVERRIDCACHTCKRKQIPLRLGWALTIHKCQGMTVGEGECHRYIVIYPGTRAFESRNPGALFVALSRAKSAGNATREPDFAWHSSVLVNEDRLCHVVNTNRVKARSSEIARIESLYVVSSMSFTEQAPSYTPACKMEYSITGEMVRNPSLVCKKKIPGLKITQLLEKSDILGLYQGSFNGGIKERPKVLDIFSGYIRDLFRWGY
ncbi:uncharacterized protein LOC123560749 [Mercenaria mercenaria]|uniref:uncharacterized protein LOC123560749 n=1 Tax=Mercenaria mercenaria TaxID=6596 RepID=UPI00234E5C22|nr:uncharacterized protein LOC123560749 [Mercenaria mercenaria]